MKIAIVHDWLVKFGGAEKVLEAIYELYDAPIYTLITDYKNINQSTFKNAEIHTSFIQSLPKAIENYSFYLPIFPLAIEQFDLSEYDMVISSSHAVAKGVITGANQLHICYCHTPMRYAWDLYHFYMNSIKNRLKRFFARLILHYLRIWDLSTVNRVDYFVANSKYVSKRIKKIYGKDCKVIYPPVDVKKFNICEKKEDFYLIVSRLVPYKRIDIAVQAFGYLKDKKLLVIGDGPELKKLKKLASKNIEFLGYQTENVVKNYMEKAKAFIFPAEEDFGIAPVEAQACGTPVIAYRKGGSLETIINKKTGLFFDKQDVKSLVKAIKDFENLEDKLNPYEIRKNSERFRKERFIEEFKSFVEEKKEEYFKQF